MRTRIELTIGTMFLAGHCWVHRRRHRGSVPLIEWDEKIGSIWGAPSYLQKGEPKMTDIDCSDCGVRATVGLRTRAALYNHMRAFLIAEINGRGLAAEDPKLLNMLTI